MKENTILTLRSFYNAKPKLTSREREVLLLVAHEMTNAEISKKLFISVATVEAHRAKLSHKLDVRNTAGLIKKAFQMGFFAINQIA